LEQIEELGQVEYDEYDTDLEDGIIIADEEEPMVLEKSKTNGVEDDIVNGEESFVVDEVDAIEAEEDR